MTVIADIEALIKGEAMVTCSGEAKRKDVANTHCEATTFDRQFSSDSFM